MSLKLGIIGGSGIYDFDGLDNKKIIPAKQGPFGFPSGDVIFGELDDVKIFFLPRHGANHSYNPSKVPYRANIDFLKRLGCNDVISLSAVGSLKEELSPGKFIIVNQFIDLTYARDKTFFDRNIVAHVSMAIPTCLYTSNLVYKASQNVGIDIQNNGTYLAMEGPQFSSLAESLLYRNWNCDVIGMTNMPEAKLAREAEIRYVPIAMVTDYDCWRENDDNVGVEEIIKNLTQNSNNAKLLIKSFVKEFSINRSEDVIDGIDNVLDTSIITKNITKEDLIENGLDAIASRILNAYK